MFSRFIRIAKLTPVAVDSIYQELTGDTSAPPNLELRQRLQLATEGLEDILTDLRHNNPGGQKYEAFWKEMELVLK